MVVGAQPSRANISPGLKQAYVDLAKSWWIIKEVTPSHPELRRYGNASVRSMVPILENLRKHDLAKLAQYHVDVFANIRALAISMKRNERLPPELFEIQRLDTRVLLDNQPLPTEVLDAIAAQSSSSQFDHTEVIVPLGDSETSFAFGRMFGTGSLVSRRELWDTITLPSMISLSRTKKNLDLTVTISSQDGSLYINIQADSDRPDALNWSHVNWSSSGNFLSITIARDIDLSIVFSEYDYRALWSICDYTRKVQKDFRGRRGEEVKFEVNLYEFQCLKSKQHANSCPSAPVRNCKRRLFPRWQRPNPCRLSSHGTNAARGQDTQQRFSRLRG